MLTIEQAEEIKKQLMENIEKNFPEDKRQFAVSQIESMNSEGLEEFLNKNNLNVPDGNESQCIFCSIISGKISSYKIGEIPEALAVLEINPVSKGHVIIIPKEHSLDYGKESDGKIKEFIKTVSEKMVKALQSKGITIENSSLFGHQVINLIPNYDEDSVSLKSERQSAKPEELAELQKLLIAESESGTTPTGGSGEALRKASEEETSKPKKQRIKKLTDKNTWLPKRIP
ncbi:MAG: HIT family protein [Nanoarchaeota archaeon]|nr:HIT family protein [Nanoarchaeota archaeon]MBU1501465.1 HIT family protein [Nanoarchaeota archaeon]MBU2459230.1 HIT family protein [Nanoarchaeota archaeon]